jgi:NAD(P)-dependent dehydrogenase (short-subunit alcohol dehydrogenase family)
VGEFDGRVALVTGGGRGIGRAICVALAEAGADVGFSYRGDEAAADWTLETITQQGRRGLAMQTDMGDAGAVRSLVERVRSDLGPVTLLVNNAAYTHLLSPDDLTYERWQRFVRTNVDAPYLTTWGVKDDMIAAGGGAIVNVSSHSATAPQPGMAGYGMSKGALNAFTKACASEFVQHGIRVNAVVPGLVLTPRAATTSPEVLAEFTRSIPMGRGGTAEEIAEAAMFLLSKRASYITGELLVVAGGQH